MSRTAHPGCPHTSICTAENLRFLSPRLYYTTIAQSNKEATTVPYTYLEHTADLGIRAVGDTIEEAFGQGAQAMLDAITDTRGLACPLSSPVTCRAPDLPALFCEWLNELLYLAEVRRALWKNARVTRLARTGAEWALEGVVHGEPLDPERHDLHTEVKAATYAGLSYRQSGGQHILECVLDL
jgi:tRNA nucleotidyltransferase (CCA-adding enzyme)